MVPWLVNKTVCDAQFNLSPDGNKTQTQVAVHASSGFIYVAKFLSIFDAPSTYDGQAPLPDVHMTCTLTFSSILYIRTLINTIVNSDNANPKERRLVSTDHDGKSRRYLAKGGPAQ